MSFPDFVDLCTDEEAEVKDVIDVRPDFVTNLVQEKASFIITNSQPGFEEFAIRQWFEENGSLNGLPNSSWVTDVGNLSANGFCHVHALPGSLPLRRQFWKAGDYEAGPALGPISQNRQNHLRVHPKFLHSNATSHKWAFGAIAELLDNAVDEVHNGATFVIIDKISNLRNGNHALLIQDDGGGMTPESLRHCTSFGFSEKQSDCSIGHYGNGFKTSTMRLGADVIVFSRCMDKRTLTQSVGLLSYTFLRQTGCDDIIVPMVDYVFDPSAGVFRKLLRHGQRQFSSNLSTLLRWSPFATEVELLKQFDDIGHHGTKIVVFNLWLNGDGDMELDFDSDAEDIIISGAPKIVQGNRNVKMFQKHIANRFRYSLRVYSSILYLHLPENFRILLRGRVVEPHHIVNDLIYRECIKYKPQVGGPIESTIITTIGFLDGAPHLNVHGFNIYHKNRLILPFSPVFSNTHAKGRGVSGVLEVNYIKPTHDKQDFEKSILYQKLETRLKEMTLEYWDYHCHLVGYPSKKIPPPTSAPTSAPATSSGIQQAVLSGIHSSVRPVTENSGFSTVDIPGAAYITNCSGRSQKELPQKRRHVNHIESVETLKKRAVVGGDVTELGSNHKNQHQHDGRGRRIQELITMVRENKKLHTQCLEFEKGEKQLLLKEQKLRNELQEVQLVYQNLLVELKSLDEIKVEM